LAVAATAIILSNSVWIYLCMFVYRFLPLQSACKPPPPSIAYSPNHIRPTSW